MRSNNPAASWNFVFSSRRNRHGPRKGSRAHPRCPEHRCSVLTMRDVIRGRHCLYIHHIETGSTIGTLLARANVYPAPRCGSPPSIRQARRRLRWVSYSAILSFHKVMKSSCRSPGRLSVLKVRKTAGRQRERGDIPGVCRGRQGWNGRGAVDPAPKPQLASGRCCFGEIRPVRPPCCSMGTITSWATVTPRPRRRSD